MTVKILNKRASLVTLPAVKASKECGAWPMKKLAPGVNLVSAEYFEALVGKDGDKHEGVAALFDKETGILDLVEEGEPLIPVDAKLTLKGAKLDAAVSLVEACGDVEQLGVWLHADDRKGVHKAIAARLEVLEAKAADDKAGGL